MIANEKSEILQCLRLRFGLHHPPGLSSFKVIKWPKKVQYIIMINEWVYATPKTSDMKTVRKMINKNEAIKVLMVGSLDQVVSIIQYTAL